MLIIITFYLKKISDGTHFGYFLSRWRKKQQPQDSEGGAAQWGGRRRASQDQKQQQGPCGQGERAGPCSEGHVSVPSMDISCRLFPGSPPGP